MPTVKVRLNTSQLTATIGARLDDPVRPNGAALVSILHDDVARQFDSESYHHGSITETWLPAQRVIRRLGGSPRTLDDTGAYRAAWTGKGAGKRTSVRERGISVGVDSNRFPQVDVFQGRVQTHVEERPVGVSDQAARLGVDLIAAYVATGAN